MLRGWVMRTFICIGVASTMVMALAVSTLMAQGTGPSLVEFKSAEHGFSLLYLSSWKPEEHPADAPKTLVLRLRPIDAPADKPSAVVIVMVTPAKASGEAPTFDDVQAAVVDFAVKGNAPDAKPVVSTEVTLGGQKARRVIMAGTDKRYDAPMKAVVLVTVHNGKGFALALAAPNEDFDRVRKGFDTLTQSFKFGT